MTRRDLAVGAAARARGYYTREEFIQVCAWKTVRSRPKVAANTEAAVVDATGRALAATDEAIRITSLLELEGVGVPTASTLLYFAFPDDYPILDVRALESLGVKPRSTIPGELLAGVSAACRQLARRRRGERPHARQGALAVLQGAQPRLSEPRKWIAGAHVHSGHRH